MSFFIRFGLFILVLLWFTGIILPFIAIHFNGVLHITAFTKILYSPVCHQDADKFFCFNSICTAVCARCFGIYGGALLTSVFVLAVNIKKCVHIKFLFFSAVPLLLDVLLTNAGFYSYSKPAAALTGFIFGSAAFYYFCYGIKLLIKEREEKSWK